MAKQTVSASMPEDLVARLEARAAASGLTKSALVVMAVERLLAPTSAPGGADLTRYPLQPTAPVVDAETPPPAPPAPTLADLRAMLPPGYTLTLVKTPLLRPAPGKENCAHPLGQRRGTVCMACGAQAIR